MNLIIIIIIGLLRKNAARTINTHNNTKKNTKRLLITIRSFTLLCDHSRSKTRLIAIMNLIAKLGIIYANACHARLYTTNAVVWTECQLSLPPHSAYYYMQTRPGEWRWGLMSQQLALWVCVKCCACCH